MEGFNENYLSAEQQERQEKFVELSEIMAKLSESFTNSNDAYEVRSSIEDFKNDFETGDLRLKDYLLGGVLLSSEEDFDQSKYEFFDTENNDIENFIRGLEAQKQEKMAA